MSAVTFAVQVLAVAAATAAVAKVCETDGPLSAAILAGALAFVLVYAVHDEGRHP